MDSAMKENSGMTGFILLRPWGFRSQSGKWLFILFLTGLSLPTIASSPLTWAATQEKQPKNPFVGQPGAINEGQSIFRNSCAMCHGTDAQGGLKGPNLASGRLTHGDSDASLFQIITKGVPGTPMPGSDFTEEKTWKIVAYLRSLAVRAAVSVLGNRTAGEEIFFEKIRCSQCHMVSGRGGRLGPDLSRIGAARSIPYLKDKIREPGKLGKDMKIGLWWELGLPLIYQTVTLVTTSGRRITGALRNEDTFSIQLMDPSEELHMFLKRDLQEVIHEQGSLMPGYDVQTLSEKELQNLLAYLDSLREP